MFRHILLYILHKATYTKTIIIIIKIKLKIFKQRCILYNIIIKVRDFDVLKHTE